MKRALGLVFIFVCLHSTNAQKCVVFTDSKESIIKIALNKLSVELEFSMDKLEDFKTSKADKKIVLLQVEKHQGLIKKNRLQLKAIKSEGYQRIKKENTLYLVGGDNRGLMYALLDLRDHIASKKGLASVGSTIENPHFPFRAIKFNLPWSSYRLSQSIQMHYETVRDTNFWASFFDMMADNRFNTITLWNLHPFTFMIQPKHYPEAKQFTGQEFSEWQQFWHTLFRMAKDRGIDSYILNWNIFTSPGMTETHNVANYKDDLEWHYGFTPADTSQIIIDYMRECITQTINEYPNLTGVGVSLGERMKMPIEDAMEWVKQTFVEGIRQADRPARFIHRAPFSVHPTEARKYIESYTDFEDPIIMEFKFNWSHGHSSPNLSITHGGKVSDGYWNPKPSNYKMAWMMRNEDFINLNWGNTDFIREHIAANDFEDITYGYFVGSETYIPAKEFRIKPGVDYNWKYAFEKQWEFYSMWGRLLYNPQLPDAYFINQFNTKYGTELGAKLFEALKLASEMPLELASFYRGTWDFTLYCEGFLNGKQIYRNYKEFGEAFIRVDEMIKHPTLDKRYLNIDTYVNRLLHNKEIKEGEITPLKVANKMQGNAKAILKLCADMEGKATQNRENFTIERNDVKAWAYLSLYFAEKLRGGVCLDQANKTNNKIKREQAVSHLTLAAKHWDSLIESTAQYNEVSLLHIKTYPFHWRHFKSKVLKDIEIAKGF